MSIKIAEIKKSCLDKWCNSESELDDRLKTFNEKFESWIQQIPPENRSTVITLVENLEYYSHRFTNSWLKTLHSRLLESPGISDENTIYVFIKSNLHIIFTFYFLIFKAVLLFNIRILIMIYFT